MKTYPLLVLSVLFFGCGGEVPWPESGFQYEGMAGCFRVFSEEPIHPVTLTGNFNRLQRALRPIIEDVCQYRMVAVHVLFVDGWGPDGATTGYYSAFDGIALGRNMRSWPHEILHAKDASNLCPGTMWHENWVENGYNDAQAAYEVGLP